MRTPLAIAGALTALLPVSAAGAQMNMIAPAEVAGVARARALDFRISTVSPVTSPQPLVRGMIVSQEVAPNAIIGVGLSNLYGRNKNGGDFRINGGPGRGKRPAISFRMRF